MQLIPARGRLLGAYLFHHLLLVMQLIPARGRLHEDVVSVKIILHDAAYPREGTVTSYPRRI